MTGESAAPGPRGAVAVSGRQRAWPDGITLRSLTMADVPAGLALCRAAGWNQTEADWELLVALGGERGVAALAGERVVGTLTSVAFEDRFAWVGMVLVEPEMRGRGIGRALLEAALDRLGARPARLDATPQGHPLYRSLGFVDECRLSRMTSSASAPADPPQAEGPRPMRRADLDAVGEWDREVFGADRRRLLRWALDLAPKQAFVLEAGGGLVGYCLGRSGRLFGQIGPVVAASMDAAARLVAACRLELLGTPLAIDVPTGVRGWKERLDALGFVEQRPFVRMCRGDNRHSGRPDEYFAIFGPEWG